MLGIKLNDLSTKKLIFILCLVVFLVYANSLFNDFVWDDWLQIINNTIVRDLSNLPLLFRGSTFESGREVMEGIYYKPLLSLFFMINFFLWGERPFGFHLFQLMLHLGNVVLVFLISKELLEKEKIKKGQLMAFGIALVFGVHPANVEAIAYIAATQEVLYSFFCLTAFWFMLKSYPYTPWAGGVLFLLALLSKEAAIAGGGVILFYLFLFKRKKFWQWLLVLGSAFGIYLWLRLMVAKLPLTSRGVMPIAQASLSERILTIPWEFFSYLRIIFWPKVLSVSQHFVVKEMSIRDFWFPLGIDLFFLGSFLFWAIKRGSRLFWFFGLWFLGPIFLHLNILPLSMTVAERWLYFPLIGFLGALSLVISQISENRKDVQKFFCVGFILILVGLSARTIKRNFDWQNELKLLSHDVVYSQNAYDLENNLGVELLWEGRIDEAIIHFERSIELNPIEPSSRNSLGYALYLKGDLDEAEKILLRSLTLTDNYPAYKILALVYIKQEKYDLARAALDEAILRFPKTPKIEDILKFLEESEKRSLRELD